MNPRAVRCNCSPLRRLAVVRPAGIEPATYGFEGHAPDATTGRHRTTSSSIRELGSPPSWGWRPVPTADVRWLWASRGQVMGSRWAGPNSNDHRHRIEALGSCKAWPLPPLGRAGAQVCGDHPGRGSTRQDWSDTPSAPRASQSRARVRPTPWASATVEASRQIQSPSAGRCRATVRSAFTKV